MAAIIRHFADRMPDAESSAPAAVTGRDKAIYGRMARRARVRRIPAQGEPTIYRGVDDGDSAAEGIRRTIR